MRLMEISKRYENRSVLPADLARIEMDWIISPVRLAGAGVQREPRINVRLAVSLLFYRASNWTLPAIPIQTQEAWRLVREGRRAIMEAD
ncbi:hypothetical protein TNIN_293731 [Trichonephila inaurata madagascariensis]|uniref:Uncharacterized protein n=1 Tax=Trichonephila inaurata madagascariensis TaxID=2747483 RepID=A0A8X6IG01_9ARAC|nr:hypothetical protein TNIN_293731 [Trichonephila inaurata madagascariensis]